MELVFVSCEQSRLNFFRDQLAAANRRLDWSMKHNPDWYDQSEKGEVVSFYEWAVKGRLGEDGPSWGLSSPPEELFLDECLYFGLWVRR